MTSSTLRFDHLQHQFEENPRRHFVPLANAFLQDGNAHRAVELCRTFLPQLPGHVSGHVVLAGALRALGSTDDARAEYERVLALDAENLVAVRALGDLAAERGNAMEARGWYARLAELDPRDASVAARLDELTRMAAVPIAPPYAAVTGDELDERQEEIAATPVPAEERDQMLAEEFTAGFFASVLDEPATFDGPSDPSSRFAPPAGLDAADGALAIDALPGADELHATLTSGWDVGGSDRDAVAPGSVELESSFIELDAATASAGDVTLDWELEPADPHAAIAPDASRARHGEDAAVVDTPVIVSRGSDVPRAPTPTRSPIMAEFPDDEAAAGDLDAAQAPAFVTETMADLYLRQGFRAEALAVYRQLLAASPGDARLQARAEELARPASLTPDVPLPVIGAAAESTDALPAAVSDAAPFAVNEPTDDETATASTDAATAADAPPIHAVATAGAGGTVGDERTDGLAASAMADDAWTAPPIGVSSSGMLDGVAGVADAGWALATPTATGPTVSAWLSGLVAGSDDAIVIEHPAVEAAPAADEPSATISPEPAAAGWDGGSPAPDTLAVDMPDRPDARHGSVEESSPLVEDAVVAATAAETTAWPTAEATAALDERTETYEAVGSAAYAVEAEASADLEPLSPIGAGIAPAGDVAIQPDENAGRDATADTSISVDTWDDPFAWDDDAAPPVPPASTTDEFSLDALFAQPASAADEAAADTLAATTLGVAGAEPADRALDAAAAADDAGIGGLLREPPDASHALAAAPEPVRGGSFSFEQFFRATPAAGSGTMSGLPTSSGGGAAPAAPVAPTAPPARERDEDLDEFHRWLAGLSDS